MFGCQKKTHEPAINKLILSVEDDEESAQTLSEIYESEINQGEAELYNENLISFYNSRLSDETLRDLQVEVEAHQNLLASDNYYLCVNNYLSGYEEKPEVTSPEGRVELPRTLVPVTIFEGEGSEHIIEASNGDKHIFWHIGYDYSGVPYWGKRGIKYANGREQYWITKYSECPRIQDELFEEEVAQLERQTTQTAQEQYQQSSFLPARRSSVTEYVCTDDSVLNAYLSREDVENGTVSAKIERGAHLARPQNSQGCDSEPVSETCTTPFISERNDEQYVFVSILDGEVENLDGEISDQKQFWVASEYLKSFEACPSIHTEPVYACAENPISLYESNEDILDQNVSETAAPLSTIYKRHGDYFKKKIFLDEENKEIVYVPVSFTQLSDQVYWVKESEVPSECPLNLPVPVDYDSLNGQSCRPLKNDKFPLEHAARLPIYQTSAAYRAERYYNGRFSHYHQGVDLYSFYRPAGSVGGFGQGAGSNARHGGFVSIINDSEISGFGTFKHTQYILTKSRVQNNRTWLYGEIGEVSVSLRHGLDLSRGDVIARTEQYVLLNKRFPSMLHLVLYNSSGTRSNVQNPSCIIEYMSIQNFSKTWEGGGINELF